ncbi:uncharacterized protein [Littorina saxatilis]|uniref:uncharacterized protein n=1 Tax=Littorina saxatilis TaxID=31220 RepID=UPI0038B54F96
MDDDNTTQLVTKEIDRDKHDNKTVKCVAGSMGATCSLNVISRAELSDCRVDIDTDWTVRGSCQFNKAYSSRTTGISCKWYRKHNKGATSFLTDGIVTEQLTTLGNKTYYNGSCSFSVNVSRTQTGTHTFYIDVMPGPGKTETGTHTFYIDVVPGPGKTETGQIEIKVCYQVGNMSLDEEPNNQLNKP